MNKEEHKEINRLTKSQDYIKGYDAGVKHHQQHIDEALRLYQQEYANTKISERPNGWTVLEDIKKINK